MDLREFLKTVVTGPWSSDLSVQPMGAVQSSNKCSDLVEAYFLLALAPQNGQGWWEEWFRWPDDLEKILQFALKAAVDNNVYFSTYLFSKPQSKKENVLPSRTIQADLDYADILKLPIQPSILVQTSENRHQAYWLLKEKWISAPTGDDPNRREWVPPLDPEAHEVLSRKLTYAIEDCDTSGWPLGRRVRLPYTFNFKYVEGPQEIKILATSLKQYDEADFELLSDPPGFLVTPEDVEFIDVIADGQVVGDEVGPHELLKSIEKKLAPTVVAAYNVRQQDRSKALWALQCGAFRAGLSRDQVWYLSWHSANNKFADLGYHAERELAKDVLRAEAAVKSKVPDARLDIAVARRQSGPAHERRQEILQIVLNNMKATGEFIHCADDTCWYIRTDLGRPILITQHSEWMNVILDLQFGLNGTETDQVYVTYGIYNFVKSMPTNGSIAALSYYDQATNSLMLHTGHKDVVHITADNIAKVPDGSYGIVFPWDASAEPFTPVFTDLTQDWGEVVFRSALGNLIGLEQDDALALLKVWFLFLLFKDAAVSRPILAFFGQPGAGKSTLFRRIYRLLYGRQRAVEGISSPDNFDQVTSTVPFLVLDNVDVPEKWLPDRLALSASASNVTKRKLYTDADTFVVKRQALLGITAHDPHFNREDVADRLLLLTFSRLEKFLPEGDILHNIFMQRNRLWGSIVLDCQKVLQTPLPSYADVPQFRIEDFARTGHWIATALGIQEQFTNALKIIGKGQRSLNLEEDHILVSVLQRFVSMPRKGETFYTATGLWAEINELGSDPQAFKRVYRNPIRLARKLWALQDSLKEIFEVEWKQDTEKGAKVWRIGALKKPTNGVVHYGQDETSNGLSATQPVPSVAGRGVGS